MGHPVLSVIIISHNQKSQVKRCLDSVLSQSLPFEYEIIISDDNSSDGTWELENDYAKRFPEIKCFQNNSDDCSPCITSERSGHNRSNAYSHCSGKYFVHIDADDCYRPGSDCLARQVELLEQHPECSMCMQDEWCWDEGAPLESGHANHPLHRFSTGDIITAETYFKKNIWANNGVMMMRRDARLNPAEIYHKWYVDTIITAHYLQYGPIVCLDRNDWIYTQTPDTITNKIKENDRVLLWGLDLTVFTAYLIPGIKCDVYTSSFAMGMLLDAIRSVISKAPISEQIRNFCKQFNNLFIYRVAAKPSLSLIEKARLYTIRNLIKYCLKGSLLKDSLWLKVIHKLCTA